MLSKRTQGDFQAHTKSNPRGVFNLAFCHKADSHVEVMMLEKEALLSLSNQREHQADNVKPNTS